MYCYKVLRGIVRYCEIRLGDPHQAGSRYPQGRAPGVFGEWRQGRPIGRGVVASMRHHPKLWQTPNSGKASMADLPEFSTGLMSHDDMSGARRSFGVILSHYEVL